MRKGLRARVIVVCVIAALFVLHAACSLAQLPNAQWPSADGTQKKQTGGLLIDYSHADSGYIMAKGPKTQKRLKLRVKFEDRHLDYDLPGDGEYATIPLQLGSGQYTFILYKNVSGKQYAEEGRIRVDAELTDPNDAFLYPNLYVTYDQETAAVQKSAELCEGLTSQQACFDAIFDFIKSGFAYDFIKSVTVKAGTMPDIDGCYEKRMGICQDLAAMSVSMLRVQGIPAKLMIGNLNTGVYHAWVVAVIDGREVLFDPTAEVNPSYADVEYTIERYY